MERVELFTHASLVVLLWGLLGLGAFITAVLTGQAGLIAVVAAVALVLAVTGTILLGHAIRLYPERSPLPRTSLAAQVGAAAVAGAALLLLPEPARLPASATVVASLTWSAGGLRDQRVQWLLYVASPVLLLVATRSVPAAAYGLALGLFLVFTVQSSLWLLGVVTELDDARASRAALAVAEERLRFSRDVHDVMGRRLSGIAVQAELAATLAARGDERAPSRIRDVRETAHVALREARELARGYRPLDLPTEVQGAVSLLRSAGIDTAADLDDLPPAWHEPVARVVREGVTNVLRHSRATSVSMSYADGEVVIRNDGAARPQPESGGSGLRALEEDLEPMGAALTTQQEGQEFVVRVRLDAGKVGR